MWTIAYYSERVKNEVFSLPVGIRADYLRLLGIMEKFGADLRMPHSRAMGDGLVELRPRGREGIGRVFYCTQIGRRVAHRPSAPEKGFGQWLSRNTSPKSTINTLRCRTPRPTPNE